jgi:hypothetical protein
MSGGQLKGASDPYAELKRLLLEHGLPSDKAERIALAETKDQKKRTFEKILKHWHKKEAIQMAPKKIPVQPALVPKRLKQQAKELVDRLTLNKPKLKDSDIVMPDRPTKMTHIVTEAEANKLSVPYNPPPPENQYKISWVRRIPYYLIDSMIDQAPEGERARWELIKKQKRHNALEWVDKKVTLAQPAPAQPAPAQAPAPALLNAQKEIEALKKSKLEAEKLAKEERDKFAKAIETLKSEDAVEKQRLQALHASELKKLRDALKDNVTPEEAQKKIGNLKYQHQIQLEEIKTAQDATRLKLAQTWEQEKQEHLTTIENLKIDVKSREESLKKVEKQLSEAPTQAEKAALLSQLLVATTNSGLQKAEMDKLKASFQSKEQELHKLQSELDASFKQREEAFSKANLAEEKAQKAVAEAEKEKGATQAQLKALQDAQLKLGKADQERITLQTEQDRINELRGQLESTRSTFEHRLSEQTGQIQKLTQAKQEAERLLEEATKSSVPQSELEALKNTLRMREQAVQDLNKDLEIYRTTSSQMERQVETMQRSRKEEDDKIKQLERSHAKFESRITDLVRNELTHYQNAEWSAYEKQRYMDSGLTEAEADKLVEENNLIQDQLTRFHASDLFRKRIDPLIKEKVDYHTRLVDQEIAKDTPEMRDKFEKYTDSYKKDLDKAMSETRSEYEANKARWKKEHPDGLLRSGAPFPEKEPTEAQVAAKLGNPLDYEHFKTRGDATTNTELDELMTRMAKRYDRKLSYEAVKRKLPEFIEETVTSENEALKKRLEVETQLGEDFDVEAPTALLPEEDLYQLTGVPRDSDQKEVEKIQRRYKSTLAREKKEADPKIETAFEILSNPNQRRWYNLERPGKIPFDGARIVESRRGVIKFEPPKDISDQALDKITARDLEKFETNADETDAPIWASLLARKLELHKPPLSRKDKRPKYQPVEEVPPEPAPEPSDAPQEAPLPVDQKWIDNIVLPMEEIKKHFTSREPFESRNYFSKIVEEKDAMEQYISEHPDVFEETARKGTDFDTAYALFNKVGHKDPLKFASILYYVLTRNPDPAPAPAPAPETKSKPAPAKPSSPQEGESGDEYLLSYVNLKKQSEKKAELQKEAWIYINAHDMSILKDASLETIRKSYISDPDNPKTIAQLIWKLQNMPKPQSQPRGKPQFRKPKGKGAGAYGGAVWALTPEEQKQYIRDTAVGRNIRDMGTYKIWDPSLNQH